MFDVSCYYDPETRRWFHVGETLDDDPVTGEVTGRGRIDFAVSQTANPLGRWNFYAIPTQNDGTEGTPDHGCDPPPCFSDFPHVGADHNGFYITANEFALFGDEFTGANVYAIAKRQLAAGVGSRTSSSSRPSTTRSVVPPTPSRQPSRPTASTSARRTAPSTF